VSEPSDEYGDLDVATIFQALDEHGVSYVVVGGSAAILWGAQRATRDVDCVAQQSTDNFTRLCKALSALGRPRLRIEGVDDTTAIELSSQLLHPDFFERTEASTWRTDAGSIDILASIPDLTGQPVGYEDLRRRSSRTTTGDLQIPVASLDDVIDSKTHANRAKDRDALPELRELQRRIRRHKQRKS
jgi:predicted nucleotidyltransferase